MKPSKTDLAYLAGIIDGEGCITVHSTNLGIGGPYLLIGGTDKRLVIWLKNNFGGNYSEVNFTNIKHKHHKTPYLWHSSLCNTTKILELTLPYLIIKSAQAKLAIRFRRLIGTVGHSVPTINLQKRISIVDKIRKLNRRGR